MNPVIYIPQSKRLLVQLCEVLRYKHYSFKTEQACADWGKIFASFDAKVAILALRYIDPTLPQPATCEKATRE